MARPITKEQLEQAGRDYFNKLLSLIDSLTEDEQKTSFSFEDRDKNIRDVLIHLYEWHRLFLKWTSSNRKGNKINFLPEPYNWKTYPKMNVEFWEKHQHTTLEEAKEYVNQSHKEVMQVISSFSNEELFTNKYFSWTGTTSLGSYSVSVTSSHYDWAMKKIKKHKQNL